MSFDQPRPHHYLFAHVRLPRIVLDPAADVRRPAATGRLTEALTASWSAVGDTLEAVDRLPPDGLTGELVTAGGIELMLVTLPLPVALTEAHFVALAPCWPPGARRYFTLEKAVGEQRTMLGEWAEQTHVNFGSGPRPDAAAFVAAVCAMLPVSPDSARSGPK